MSTKICTSCKTETPLENMGKNRRSKDGYNIYCKPCVREMSQKQRDENIEQNRKWQATYSKRNKEKIKEKNLKRYYLQKERLLVLQTARRKRDYERVREIEKAAYERNKHKWRERANERQAFRRKYFNGTKFLITDKDLQKLYNGKCYNCGSRDRPSIDHIIPISRGGNHSIGNLGTLCLSCNTSKKDRTIMEWKISRRKKF